MIPILWLALSLAAPGSTGTRITVQQQLSGPPGALVYFDANGTPQPVAIGAGLTIAPAADGTLTLTATAPPSTRKYDVPLTGSNYTYALPSGRNHAVYLNGLRVRPGIDYEISATSIKFLYGGSSADAVTCDYDQ